MNQACEHGVRFPANCTPCNVRIVTAVRADLAPLFELLRGSTGRSGRSEQRQPVIRPLPVHRGLR